MREKWLLVFYPLHMTHSSRFSMLPVSFYQSVTLELWDQVLILHCKTFWA